MNLSDDNKRIVFYAIKSVPSDNVFIKLMVYPMNFDPDYINFWPSVDHKNYIN